MKIIIYDWFNGDLLSKPGIGYIQGQEIEDASIDKVLEITNHLLLNDLNVMILQHDDGVKICVSNTGFGQR